ncbi:MAG TPA: hypothetical protein VFA81_12195, partial [Burkholderiales bacterium]|nr:hypothetical protein [Burkholderiales bacterium]
MDSVFRASTAILIGAACAVSLIAGAPRETAVWILRQGGSVALDGKRIWISDLARLPSGDLRVTGADLSGTHIDPSDLKRIGELSDLRELFLPGYMWNNSAGSKMDANDQLRNLAGLKNLVKLHLGMHFLTDVHLQDKGVELLAPLTQLQELRLEQTRIKGHAFAPFVHMRCLDLTYSNFDDEGMENLKGMSELSRLYVRDTLVTDAGLEAIANLRSLT